MNSFCNIKASACSRSHCAKPNSHRELWRPCYRACCQDPYGCISRFPRGPTAAPRSMLLHKSSCATWMRQSAGKGVRLATILAALSGIAGLLSGTHDCDMWLVKTPTILWSQHASRRHHDIRNDRVRRNHHQDHQPVSEPIHNARYDHQTWLRRTRAHLCHRGQDLRRSKDG